MKEKKIFDAITNIPDNLVEEARKTKLKHTTHSFRKWIAFAACAVFVIGFVFALPHFHNNSGEALLDKALLNVVFPKAYAFEDYDARRTLYENNPVESAFLEALNEFSYQTAAQVLSDSNGNTNYSPLSLYYALAIAASGAKGETADELFSLLGVSDQDTLSEQCGNLYRRLYTDNKIGTLKIGSSLWMDSGINWKNNFVKNAAENLYAHSFSVDFSDTKTSQSMAKWVSENTNGTINPDVKVNPEQILSILNTVYFYDEWIDKFDKAKTAEDTFYLSDSTVVKCDFMNGSYGSHYFVKGEGFTRSVLTLKNTGSMIFILPDEGIPPKELLSSPNKIKEVFEGGEGGHGEVVWQIPKFNFNSEFDLTNTLQNLGIHSAFEQNANFSGITNHMAFITNLRQETHISIDENGVEASAFTQIDSAGAASPQDRADMILNRPFIYGITASDGTILFIGICENPIVN